MLKLIISMFLISRSPGSGLYDTLDDHEISDPMEVFDISVFDLNPRPFYRIAKYLHPANYRPNYCHYFIKLLLEKGLLLRIYTQNIDGLERSNFKSTCSLVITVVVLIEVMKSHYSYIYFRSGHSRRQTY